MMITMRLLRMLMRTLQWIVKAELREAAQLGAPSARDAEKDQVLLKLNV